MLLRLVGWASGEQVRLCDFSMPISAIFVAFGSPDWLLFSLLGAVFTRERSGK